MRRTWPGRKLAGAVVGALEHERLVIAEALDCAFREEREIVAGLGYRDGPVSVCWHHP